MPPHTNILRIAPTLFFPREEVFEVPDQFNGSTRGTFYYRTNAGTLRGPFLNDIQANFHMLREADDDGA